MVFVEISLEMNVRLDYRFGFKCSCKDFWHYERQIGGMVVDVNQTLDLVERLI